MKKYWIRVLIVIILLIIVILAIIRCQSLKKEHVNTNLSAVSVTAVPKPTSTIQDPEYINKETQNLIFGEWKIIKLLGFTEVQNDYTIFPNGHNIIDDHIIITKKIFSSKGIHKYKRYQSELSDPIYTLSDIKDKWFIVPTESVKKDTKLFNMVHKAYFQDLNVQDKYGWDAAVNFMISSDNHLILSIDGAFYLLEKVK